MVEPRTAPPPALQMGMLVGYYWSPQDLERDHPTNPAPDSKALMACLDPSIPFVAFVTYIHTVPTPEAKPPPAQQYVNCVVFDHNGSRFERSQVPVNNNLTVPWVNTST